MHSSHAADSISSFLALSALHCSETVKPQSEFNLVRCHTEELAKAGLEKTLDSCLCAPNPGRLPAEFEAPKRLQSQVKHPVERKVCSSQTKPLNRQLPLKNSRGNQGSKHSECNDSCEDPSQPAASHKRILSSQKGSCCRRGGNCRTTLLKTTSLVIPAEGAPGFRHILGASLESTSEAWSCLPLHSQGS